MLSIANIQQSNGVFGGCCGQSLLPHATTAAAAAAGRQRNVQWVQSLEIRVKMF